MRIDDIWSNYSDDVIVSVDLNARGAFLRVIVGPEVGAWVTRTEAQTLTASLLQSLLDSDVYNRDLTEDSLTKFNQVINILKSL